MVINSEEMWLLMMLLLSLSYANSQHSVPSISDPDFIKEVEDTHNKIRSAVNPNATNMKYMTWDPSLAKVAKAWTSLCKYEHNIHLHDSGKIHPVFPVIGENLYKGSRFNINHIIHTWASELDSYSTTDNTCLPNKVCGHYTQVIWGNTFKVGCAGNWCPSMSAYIAVCDYGPAGNVRGSRPYEIGSPCSGCPEEKCVNKLCTNLTRDALWDYPNWCPFFSAEPCESGSNDNGSTNRAFQWNCGIFLMVSLLVIQLWY
ncbi:glioma pathogenesis-related protein 1-like [Rhinophrynus dorsalis]